MRRPDPTVLASATLFAVLAAGVVPLGDAAFRLQQEERYEIRHVPSPGPLRALSPAIRLSIANYYWLQTVQYIGDQAMRRGPYDKLYRLVDLVTELDPGHGYAFQTGGLALAGALRLEESDAILKKGIERGPNWWSYPFYLGFNDFFYRGDYASAARWVEQAARTPGASTNIPKIAVGLRVKSGSPEEALRFVEQMRATVSDERLREVLDQQHQFVLLQQGFATLDAAVARFQASHGRDPARLDELVAAGLLDRIPPEPYGGEFVWRGGAVHSTGRDYRLPPAEPGRLGVPYR